MSADLDKPLTWNSVGRLALVAAAEYGMLSLIEDAPFAVKIATVICAAGALATLEMRAALNKRSAHLFALSMSVIGAIYLGFLGYAVAHSLNKIAARHGLEQIYVSGAKLMNRNLPVSAAGNSLSRDEVSKFGSDVDEWSKESAQWIEDHLNAAARERFLDISGMPSLSWSVKGPNGGNVYDADFSEAMNRLATERKNLTIIMETSAYE